jgi:small multidrug resistance family-3 protein
MQTALSFMLAAVCEIAGCYAAWAWLRLGRSVLWMAPGAVCLLVFALALTRVDAAFAGRAYAAYGGVYIASSLVWLMAVERTRPTWTDVAGSLVCVAGAAILFWDRVMQVEFA